MHVLSLVAEGESSQRLGSGGLGFTGIPLQAFAGRLNQSRGRYRDQRSLKVDSGQT